MTPPEVSVITDRRARTRSPSPPSPQLAPVLRRSTRNKRPPTYTIDSDSPAPEIPERLEQIPYSTPAELGISDQPGQYVIRVHPIAMALMTFHAHLTRTEVIGYLAGTVREHDNRIEVVILAAFPCKEVDERALARTGRSAYTEVELDPAHSVDVCQRVTANSMCIVGWYHSHPDENFTVEPSRVDIENQLNYQSLLFRDKPFVAAIVAPYNSDLPDHKPDVAFFRVFEESIPMRLSYNVTRREADELQSLTDSLNEFTAECLCLIEAYSTFPKRKRLGKSWRGDLSGIDKMQTTLCELDSHALFCQVIQNVMEEVATAWQRTADADEEKRERNKANRKKKRTKKR